MEIVIYLASVHRLKRQNVHRDDDDDVDLRDDLRNNRRSGNYDE